MRNALVVGAGVAIVAALVPPVSSVARHYEFVETIQFDLLAFIMPALLVTGRPLRWLRPGSELEALLVKRADARRRHPGFSRAALFGVAFLATAIAWRTPGLMDALQRHGWLLAVEVVSLAATGVPLWTELVESPPLSPRVVSPLRAGLAALTMWGIWIMAYLVGFSEVTWYVAYHHAAGGLGGTTDRELSTALLWLGAASVFAPRIFSDLLAWLRNGNDPDAELRALVRRERRWGPPD